MFPLTFYQTFLARNNHLIIIYQPILLTIQISLLYPFFLYSIRCSSILLLMINQVFLVNIGSLFTFFAGLAIILLIVTMLAAGIHTFIQAKYGIWNVVLQLILAYLPDITLAAGIQFRFVTSL